LEEKKQERNRKRTRPRRRGGKIRKRHPPENAALYRNQETRFERRGNSGQKVPLTGKPLGPGCSKGREKLRHVHWGAVKIGARGAGKKNTPSKMRRLEVSLEKEETIHKLAKKRKTKSRWDRIVKKALAWRSGTKRVFDRVSRMKRV